MLKKEKGIFYLVVGICVAILIILTIVGILLPKQPYSKGPLSSSLMNSHTSSSQDSEWTEPVSPVSSQAEGGVDGITLSVDQVTLEVGENQMPLVTMTPEDAPDKSEIWVSSDTNVATVDGMGRITGVGEGSCTVTVTSAASPQVSATVAVTVSGGTAVTTVTTTPNQPAATTPAPVPTPAPTPEPTPNPTPSQSEPSQSQEPQPSQPEEPAPSQSESSQLPDSLAPKTDPSSAE